MCKRVSARMLALVDTSTGAVNRRFPDADGSVNAVLADGRGGWFVGGSFACVGSVPAPALVHLHSDGTLDRSWHPALVPEPSSESRYESPTELALGDGKLYVGGPAGIQALAAGSGRRLWLDRVAGAGTNTSVGAIAASESTVFVGGGFRSIAGVRRDGLAALDPSNGRVLSWQPRAAKLPRGLPPTPLSPAIVALALSGERLYVGGDGFYYAGEPRPPVSGRDVILSQIAALDTRTGRALPWVPRKNGRSGSLAVGDVGTILVTHGEVLTAGHDGWGVSSARTGRALSWGENASAALFAPYGNIVYLAGNCRNEVQVFGATRHNLAAFDIVAGRFTGWMPTVAPYTCVTAMAASAKQMLVAGSFTKTLG